MTGTTSKSGTNIYVHEHLNSNPKPDLNFQIHETDKEEFETIWTEIP